MAGAPQRVKSMPPVRTPVVGAVRLSTPVAVWRRRSARSKTVLDANTAVKTLATRPIVSVVANPRIELVPNWKRNAAAISDVTWVSTMVIQTRSKPALTAARALRARREFLLDPFEDQHVRVDAHADRQDEAGDAGQRHRHGNQRDERNQDQQVEDDRDDRVQSGQPVVGEHEQHDERQAANGGEHARSDRGLAEACADGALLDVCQVGRQGTGLEGDDLLDHLFVAEADDLPMRVDARQDGGHRRDAAVEHGRQRAVDMALREGAEARAGVRLQREADRRTVEFVGRLARVAQVAAGHGR